MTKTDIRIIEMNYIIPFKFYQPHFNWFITLTRVSFDSIRIIYDRNNADYLSLFNALLD